MPEASAVAFDRIGFSSFFNVDRCFGVEIALSTCIMQVAKHAVVQDTRVLRTHGNRDRLALFEVLDGGVTANLVF